MSARSVEESRNKRLESERERGASGAESCPGESGKEDEHEDVEPFELFGTRGVLGPAPGRLKPSQVELVSLI